MSTSPTEDAAHVTDLKSYRTEEAGGTRSVIEELCLFGSNNSITDNREFKSHDYTYRALFELLHHQLVHGLMISINFGTPISVDRFTKLFANIAGEVRKIFVR